MENTAYEQALLRMDRLMDAEAGTPEAEELRVLVGLVEEYEAQLESKLNITDMERDFFRVVMEELREEGKTEIT